MFYERKIRYLDYYKDGQRFKSGGFAKTEVRDDIFKLEIVMKGIDCPDTNTADVLLYSDEREIILGKTAVKNGYGEFCYSTSLKNGIEGTELRYNEVRGIRILLEGETEVSCRWQEGERKVQKEEKDEAVDEGNMEERKEVETAEKDRTTAEESETTGKQPTTITLLEDKWLQLLSIYPHIKPFRDERDYLSIGPADFVLFGADSYRAANNSFLLHGYYNYRHLILTRVENRGEILYYVGVPGNYFDREKQVAIMFGFESFECGSEPAQNGDFGYYMMRVKL